MVFSSLEFIFLFLPVFLLLYFLTPEQYKNLVLFLASLLFYTLGTLDHPLYLLLMLLSIFVNFRLARRMERSPARKWWFRLGLFYNFGWLFVFKYAGLPLLLPVGISFYTFQAVSYLCDVYWQKYRSERSFVKFGTYIAMFPQLIAGPIVTYPLIRKALRQRRCSLENLTEGIQIFILGLGSKVILANRAGALWGDINAIGYESISTPLAWLGIIAYTFQIYFDFFGYSLMAIGLGTMIGFQLPQNFREPYRSRSMTEFWRRWHITLGSWFREYVYIPLGGSRRGQARTIRNLLIVWLLTGVWHGAGVSFVLWGFSLFVLIAIEKLGLKRVLDRYPLLGHLYMVICIPLTWMLFAITDLKQLKIFAGRLFPVFAAGGTVFPGDYLKYGKRYGIVLLVCLLFCTGWPQALYARVRNTLTETIVLLGVFWVSVYFLYIGLNDPFLYFRF